MYKDDIENMEKALSSECECGFITRDEYSVFYVCRGTDEKVILNTLQIYLGCEVGNNAQVINMNNDTCNQIRDILCALEARGYDYDKDYVVRQAVNRMYHFVVSEYYGEYTNNCSGKSGLVLPRTSVARRKIVLRLGNIARKLRHKVKK